MSTHVSALALLQRVWGGFGLLVAASLALLAAGGGAALADAGPLSPAARGVILVLAGCAVGLAGVSIGALATARGLERRRTPARTAALLLAAVNLLLVPFGTALAVYTVWLLLNDDARREFGRPLRGGP
jgi:hypothetical protein